MALRLRRDVQKASYYVWFLGAEEAKGLRGSRVINSVLPYLIDRSRGQEPLKVTLQVSHKGIKILQGSSKHFIPHSAITSSTQTDDIVACVLLLYNPATKCPLHVHAYRCDSESTAEALHQQLQILINRPENQKRFEELETRLGIVPPMPTSNNKSSNSTAHIKAEHSQQHFQSQKQLQQQQQQRRLETSPKRFSSSLGSDTGNSTRESECSEEHSGSPVSRSPPMIKPLQQHQSNELFDSLAAELRAKLNGNGPPILLPPRDYDTVHRSKGNLTAIELRRCRNALIVGSTTPAVATKSAIANGVGIGVGGGNASGGSGAVVSGGGGGGVAVKQVSSRGSSGIGSDLAPSPERQELNSSSDDEHWSNEADNSVIALKPSQIPIQRSNPIIPHHPQLNRKIAVQPPEDSYLRDLPAKPYMPHTASNVRHNNTSKQHNGEKISAIVTKSDLGGGGGHSEHRSKTPSTTSWNREDEIKPIIMRPADYDAKFNRVLQTEQNQQPQREYRSMGRDHAKLQDTDKYNEINLLLNKKLSLEPESPERQRHSQKVIEDDYDDSDVANEHQPLHGTSSSSAYRKENLTDKQKFIEYSTKKQPPKTYAAEETQRYAGRHRYVDPVDLPFEQPTHKKYAAIHRGAPSPDRSLDQKHHTAEHQRDRQRVVDDAPRRDSRERKHERQQFSSSSERNPYREPESIPYIQSMEKMMKSSAMRYKSFEGPTEPAVDEMHSKVSQRSKSYPKHSEERDHNYPRGNRSDYAPSASSSITPKDRFKDAKDKFRAMECTGSRHDLVEEKDSFDYKLRRRGSIEPKEGARVYEEWSDEERFNDSPTPPPMTRSRSRSRDHWEQTQQAALILRERERDVLPPREHHMREHVVRDSREQREYTRDLRPRELPGMRSENRDVRELQDSREVRDRDTRDSYRDHRYDPRDIPPPRTHEREKNRDLPPREHQRSDRIRDHSREYPREHITRREYTPEPRSGSEHRVDYTDRSMEKQRVPKPSDMFPPPPPSGGALIPNAKVISNLPKGYRHSYAEPVFARTGGRVGLAAVNPF